MFPKELTVNRRLTSVDCCFNFIVAIFVKNHLTEHCVKFNISDMEKKLFHEFFVANDLHMQVSLRAAHVAAKIRYKRFY